MQTTSVALLNTSKLPSVGTSIFTVMSQLALQHNAVNLGQGFPDYPMSDELISLVSQAMKNGNNQYVHTNGYPPLREALAEKVSELYGASINPDSEITITPGATYAIYTALTAALYPDDEVIIFEPAYDSYIPNIEINGAIPVRIPLQYPDYSIPWNDVRNAITPRTKMIIINSPHNPTGSVLTELDMEQLTQIVRGTNILILSDEVYEHLIFNNLAHQSVLKYPELFERSFVCFSFGKTYHCTGWKLGYCIAPATLMSDYRKVHQFNSFSTFGPTQIGIAEYLKNREAYKTLGALMQERKDFFELQMQATRFKALPSYGSYFQCYSYKNISDEEDLVFAKRLITERAVATIPVSAFYATNTDNKVLRFCFAKKEDTLKRAVDNLLKL